MAYKVKFIDYPLQFHRIESEVMAAIKSVLDRGELIMRQEMHDFEDHLAGFVGTKHAVAVSNCTTALCLCAYAAGFGPGDEVLSVSHTMVATLSAIHHAGATPVLVDIGDDHLINVDLIEPAITPRTKAIMPVSLNGRVCDMDRIMGIAAKHGLIVLEDSAQALGGSLHGRRAGAWGLAGCFSFYPAKLLGYYGDGGAITTDDDEFADRLRILRNHGLAPDKEVLAWGFNYRMDNLTAAVLDLKLRKLPPLLKRRRELAAIYDEHLRDVPELRLPPAPVEGGERWDVFQNYEIEAQKRDELRRHLADAGVETLLPWGGKGVHQFKALGLGHFSLPRTEEMFRKAIFLPLYAELADEEVKYVIDAVKAFYARK